MHVVFFLNVSFFYGITVDTREHAGVSVPPPPRQPPRIGWEIATHCFANAKGFEPISRFKSWITRAASFSSLYAEHGFVAGVILSNSMLPLALLLRA